MTKKHARQDLVSNRCSPSPKPPAPAGDKALANILRIIEVAIGSKEKPSEVIIRMNLQETFYHLLTLLDDDADREGLRETPARMAAAWMEWTRGIDQNPADVLTTFEDGAEHYDEMVLVRNIPFYSHCEHHLAPFFGTADIAYIPDGRVVGLSKLSRVLEIYAKRLQVQERLTVQVADAIMKHLNPQGCAVCIRARHLCMESRGIHKQGHETVTNVLRGAFRNEATSRAEFLRLINHG